MSNLDQQRIDAATELSELRDRLIRRGVLVAGCHLPPHLIQGYWSDSAIEALRSLKTAREVIALAYNGGMLDIKTVDRYLAGEDVDVFEQAPPLYSAPAQSRKRTGA